MKAAIACFGVIVLLGVSGNWTWAAPKERSLTLTRSSDKPINIRAKMGRGRKVPGGWEQVYERGKKRQVEVRQGDLTLYCDKLTVMVADEKGPDTRQEAKKDPVDKLSGRGRIKTIVASGNVKITQGTREARAGKAVYDNAARTITLSEHPRLWWDGNMVEADVFILYLDQRSYETGGDGPVKVKIIPIKNQREKQK